MTRGWAFWLSIGLLLLVFFYCVRSILLPFVLGIFIAYMLDPVTDRVEKIGANRGWATTLVIIVFFLLIGALSLLVIPLIISQFSGLLVLLPEYIARFDEQYEPRIREFLGSLPAEQIDNIKAAASNFSGAMLGLIGDFLSGLLHSGVAFINILSLVLITPVVAFYLLRDWDHLTRHIDDVLPRRHYETIRTQLAAIDATLAGFLRGQINVCLILGAFYALGLSLVGLKFGFVIGIATGLLVIFPYVGLLLGMGIGLAVAFFQFDSYGQVGAVLAVFVIGQILEGYYFTPKLVGEKVGLHPVWIIFGLLAGGALFGFLGVLLAVPVSAVVGVLLRFALKHYKHSCYFHGGVA